jgi:hypothetical protein
LNPYIPLLIGLSLGMALATFTIARMHWRMKGEDKFDIRRKILVETIIPPREIRFTVNFDGSDNRNPEVREDHQ